MTTRTFTDKNNNEWTWDETPETVKAIQELSKFAGNYPGPLYAQHPDLVKPNEYKSTNS